MKSKDHIDGEAVNEGALLYRPTTGDWDYVEIVDNEDASHLCDNCRKEWIRYEHHLRHKTKPGVTMVVGCICVQRLITFGPRSGVDPKKEEQKLRNRAAKVKKRLEKIDALAMSWRRIDNEEKWRGTTSDKKKGDQERYTVFLLREKYWWVRIGFKVFSPNGFDSVPEAQHDALAFEKRRRHIPLISGN